ncbi:DNA primase [Lactobacillus phage S16]|nr:DNA primase [Lactobacillus phage S16]
MTKFNYKTIPEELRSLKQWGLFHLKYVPERKKNTKIPLNAYNGKKGKSN